MIPRTISIPLTTLCNPHSSAVSNKAKQYKIKKKDAHQENDNSLQPFSMTRIHTLLQQLEHILQDIYTGVEELDALADFEVRSGGVVERFEIGECPEEFLAVGRGGAGAGEEAGERGRGKKGLVGTQGRGKGGGRAYG